MGYDEETLLDEDIDVLDRESSKLIVHNDDHNTFSWVIECLVELISHTLEQAEQCATIIHNNGKCQVDHGDFEKMRTLKDGLVDRGLSVTIE